METDAKTGEPIFTLRAGDAALVREWATRFQAANTVRGYGEAIWTSPEARQTYLRAWKHAKEMDEWIAKQRGVPAKP